jgi:hypothetical protein
MAASLINKKPLTIAGSGFCRKLLITTKAFTMTNLQELTEVFKPVLGYEGLYEISNLGKVRSMPRMVKGYQGNYFYWRHNA